MINIDEFAERLKTIMKYYTLNASSFADKIGVQRSAISHILTGRNKPSLDFVLKIIGEFKEVDLYWLLMGKGNFPPVRNETPQSKHNLTQLFDTIPPEAPVASKKQILPKSREKNNVISIKSSYCIKMEVLIVLKIKFPVLCNQKIEKRHFNTTTRHHCILLPSGAFLC